ncbi:aminodeoxychorismate/anthranilate synthase component II [Macrococcus equipercicus]|uniref:Aminodeoxychorismate/anthranilate synthase component II n=1 Tax=Macrococcus equipercicus TaxID=69967 RepID=A0ABQ6RB46_9STAP|nr:aminodeoxychorismate/anthranilate synthase component II [Macrococcus equipercicus]KAA1042418.1 aminodeoxychorismate/anthranilate synthase component II [Macrococcus equipercicus]
MLLMIDNYDSFTYNIVHYLEGLDYDVVVRTPDELILEEISLLHPEAIIISPGPGHPLEAELCLAVVREFQGKYPLLGICLGFQVIVAAFGGQVVQGPPVHGHQVMMTHDGQGMFEGLKNPLAVGRYHSLRASVVPDCLTITASADDVIMAVRHRSLPIEAVQYHPESVLTDCGREQLANFLKRCSR